MKQFVASIHALLLVVNLVAQPVGNGRVRYQLATSFEGTKEHSFCDIQLSQNCDIERSHLQFGHRLLSLLLLNSSKGISARLSAERKRSHGLISHQPDLV